jgi:hypothetical protein
MDIVIEVGNTRLQCLFNSSGTSRAICDALPLTSHASLWGDEVYFRIPVRRDREPGARTHLEAGDIAFWPDGNALCVFFGPTPASQGSDPVAASPVNLVGRVVKGLGELAQARPGDPIVVKWA